MKPHELHKESGPKSVGFYVITISTSRYEKMVKKEPVVDESGDIIKQLMIEAGHKLIGYTLIPDSKPHIIKAFADAIINDKVDVIISSGGTGYSNTDMTIETIKPLFDREIIGFGELFRTISYHQIGSSAYLSKATAGIISNKLIFLLPGSPDAVKLALKELIIPEIPHFLHLIRS
ncbi:MAG: molybdenum cofactor biosynthesis protein B [Sulfolobaceae archaeon]